MVAGHSGQFTPGGYLSTVKHTALAGIEPTTFRLLVRRATSCATETTKISLTVFFGSIFSRLPYVCVLLCNFLYVRLPL